MTVQAVLQFESKSHDPGDPVVLEVSMADRGMLFGAFGRPV